MSADPLVSAQAVSGQFGRLTVSPEKFKLKHPLEFMTEDLRIREDPYTRLGKASLLITNFPKEIRVTKQSIRELCLEEQEEATEGVIN